MKVWVCVETFKPFRWAVREGRRWHIVKEFESRIRLVGMRGKRQPLAYLQGEGRVVVKNGKATIYPEGSAWCDN